MQYGWLWTDGFIIFGLALNSNPRQAWIVTIRDVSMLSIFRGFIIFLCIGSSR